MSEGEEDGQFNEAATADQEQSALRAEKLDGVAKEIESAVAVNAALVELDFNLRVDTTPDGLLVQILDQEERPMFALGSARIDGAIQDLLNIIGMSVADLPYPLVITGHTDAVPFATRANYGNWELSADRANAARRALVSTGVAPERIARVSGVADTVPRNTEVPTAAENRRLTILLHYPEVAEKREMPAEIEGFAGNIPQR
ncbi:MAG: OmpA family protein [Loktanella sp.]|nr:OmpA family protein [Loktanella sp.]